MSAATLEIPLDVDLDNRPQTLLRSSAQVNPILGIVGACSINTISEEGSVMARPPLITVAPLAASANGIFAPTPNQTYVLDGTQITLYGTSSATVLGTISNAGTYSFASSPLPNNVMFQNGVAGYAYVSGAFGIITDTNFAQYLLNGLVPGIACLDGTYYVMDTNSAIWGSGFNNPTTWDQLNRINAWQDQSVPIALIQHRSYVVALKSSSMQVFYDAGNPVGSPLLPLLSAQQPVGCVEASTLRESHGDHFWVASMKDEGFCVVQMSNLQLNVVSPPSINRWIEAQYKLVGGIYNVNSPVFTAVTFSVFGHTFYALQSSTVSAEAPMAVYDISAKKWRFWLSPKLGLQNLKYSAYCLGFGFGAPVDTYFQGSQGYFRFQSLPSVNVGVNWRDQDSAGNSAAYPVQITTPILDGGTQAEKTAMRLEVFSDNQDNGTLEISWSDDDYRSWSPYVKIVLTESRAFLDDLGTFRRRAFRFRHLSPTPLRLQRASLNILVGSP